MIRTGECGLRAAIAACSLFLVLCVGQLASAQEQVVVDTSSSTLYLANEEDPGVGLSWKDVDFPTTGWSAGPFGVGYQNNTGGAHALINSYVSNLSVSVYTRTIFNIPVAAEVHSLFIGADFDDGFVAWINGEEVFRSRTMRGRPLLWNTLSGGHESSNGAVPDYGLLRDITDQALPHLVDGDNLLAIGVWNSSIGSSDMVLVPQLVINREPRRGPYLQQGTHSAVTVRWRSGEATDSRVLCGTEQGSLQLCAEDPVLRTEHTLELTSLEPNTRYYYAIGHGSGASTSIVAGNDADHYFDTAPLPGTPKPTRIWVIGDSGRDNIQQERVRDAYLGLPGSDSTELWLMLGDNAYSTGTDLEYQYALFDIYRELLRRSVVWPTIGNHDLYDAGAETWPYYDSFTMPSEGEAGGVISGTESYYSFDFGNVHFVVLNSQSTAGRQPGSAMLTWLVNDLASTASDWIIAYWHHPPYSKGSHDSDSPVETPLVEMRTNVVPILEAYGVDLVLSGHSHSYERSFLIDGHYGDTATFLESMKIDGGSGDITGDGAYVKPYRGAVPYSGTGDGAVYTVAGHAALLSTGQSIDLGYTGTEPQPNHPAMVASIYALGSVVLDIDGNRLDARNLDENGLVTDQYTIFKGGPTQPPIADFSASPLTVATAAVVDFVDMTQHGPTVWSWDLDGDGQPDSNLESPSHVYPTPGPYSIGLAVSNSAGSDQTLKVDYICATSGTPGTITGLRGDGADRFAWDPDPKATAYDVVKGDLLLLRGTGGFAGTPLDCLASGVEAEIVDTSDPGPGQANYYVARGTTCADENGTYDPAGPGPRQPRDPGLQGPAPACD